MTDLDLDAIRKLAEAANERTAPVERPDGSLWFGPPSNVQQTIEFTVYFTPARVLALVAEIERLRRVEKAATKVIAGEAVYPVGCQRPHRMSEPLREAFKELRAALAPESPPADGVEPSP